MTSFIRSFKPIANHNAKILILGSMPSPASLERGQYYGHPQNQFWKIIPRILNVNYEESYRKRKKMLLDHRIALWDVLSACRREGALDSAISHAKPNDIAGLLRRFKGIRTIICNGKTSQKYYLKHFGSLIKIPPHYLPSTSPAHASLSLKQKLNRWKRVIIFKMSRV